MAKKKKIDLMTKEQEKVLQDMVNNMEKINATSYNNWTM